MQQAGVKFYICTPVARKMYNVKFERSLLQPYKKLQNGIYVRLEHLSVSIADAVAPHMYHKLKM